MSDNSKTPVGSIIWNDLTVKNAEEISKFYSEVIGWKTEPVSMGSYNDYNMLRPEDDVTGAGICHAHGVNENLPAQWLMALPTPLNRIRLPPTMFQSQSPLPPLSAKKDDSLSP